MRDLSRIPGLRLLAGTLAFIAVAGVAIGVVVWVWDQRSSPVAGDDAPALADSGEGLAVADEPPEETLPVEEIRTDEPWPLFGRTATRSSLAAEVELAPPLREAWRLEGDERLRVAPVVAYGRVYSVSEHGNVRALDVESGTVIWEADLGRCVEASPAVSDQIVYVSLMDPAPCRRHAQRASGFVVALDASTGEELWRFEAGLVESSPLVAGGRVFVGSWDGSVYALDAGTGQEIWSNATQARVRGGVAVRQGRVYVGSFDETFYAYSARDGELLWVAPVIGNFFSTPVAVRGRVLAGTTENTLYSFDAETGDEQWSLTTGGVVYGSPAIWQETAYATSFDGNVYAIDLESGALRWRFSAGSPISSSASVIGGVVWVSTIDRRTVALDGDTGAELWSFDDGRRAQMVTDGERLYLAGDRIVYGLEPDPNAPPLEPSPPAPQPAPVTEPAPLEPPEPAEPAPPAPSEEQPAQEAPQPAPSEEQPAQEAPPPEADTPAPAADPPAPAADQPPEAEPLPPEEPSPDPTPNEQPATVADGVEGT